MKYVYNTTGTCTKQFGIEIENGKLVHLESAGGCPGNLIGMAALVQDMEIDEIIKEIEKEKHDTIDFHTFTNANMSEYIEEQTNRINMMRIN